jgi:Rod binding domain-containing protein
MNNLGLNNSDATFQARFSQAETTLKRLQNDFSKPTGEDREKLKKTAQEFESIFFKQVMEQMDKTVARGDFLSGGAGEEMFRGMLMDEVALRASTRPGGSGLGLAEEIYRQLSKAMKSPDQENQPPGQELAMPKPVELKMGVDRNEVK